LDLNNQGIKQIRVLPAQGQGLGELGDQLSLAFLKLLGLQ
jgi:hypothetical protein